MNYCNRLPASFLVAALELASARPASVAAPLTEEKVRAALASFISPEEGVRQDAVTTLAISGDARVSAFLDAFEAGTVLLWGDVVVIAQAQDEEVDGVKVSRLLDPLTREPIRKGGTPVVIPSTELKDPEINRRARLSLQRDLRLLLDLSSTEIEKRLGVLQKLGDLRQARHLPLLESALEADTNSKARYLARESSCLIRLGGGLTERSVEDLTAAARELGQMRSSRAEPLLSEVIVAIAGTADPAPMEPLRAACVDSLAAIESYHRYVRWFEYLFSGLSLGSILILMALGLSITFGLMGVINMAHGELMMVGAYATHEMQQLFVSYLPASAFGAYYVAALPAAFLAAAAAGWLIEAVVIRHLYGRPLETLLATWGVGLILIQAVRVRYGDNIAVNSPTWLRGGMELFHDSTIPYNRCFIICLCILCVGLIHALMRFTRFGLLVRAAMQNRETASSLGVNTRRMDGCTFALGSGVAGVAGCALTLIGGVTPDMGQNYVVDSFLVVVTGGVGELAGVICSGLGLGILNKFFEPFAGAVFGKVLILILVVFFIQWRPAGLYAPRGRLADG